MPLAKSIWHNDYMELSIDGFGRVVIPKEARATLGISAGDKLEMELTEDQLILRPRRPRGNLVRESGVLVWAGKPVSVDTNEALRSQRDARSKRLRGE